MRLGRGKKSTKLQLAFSAGDPVYQCMGVRTGILVYTRNVLSTPAMQFEMKECGAVKKRILSHVASDPLISPISLKEEGPPQGTYVSFEKLLCVDVQPARLKAIFRF